MADAKKLVDRVDIMKDFDEVIAPKYFPDKALDRNRMSLYGYITESSSVSFEDTITLEQHRASDYCPELSNSAIHVRETAKIRGVDIARATPGKAFAILGVLKEDILNKGVKVDNEVQFTIDKRSIILHNGVNFSLEDDIIIRAVWKVDKYIYAANYSGLHTTYESYVQMFEETTDSGDDIVVLLVQVYQYAYNIQEKTVTDDVEFLYEGLEFDYENRLADFDVYCKQNYSASGEWKKLDLMHYLSTSTNKNCIYYNDDDDNILFILNNPRLNIRTNAVIRVEIKETLGTEGNVSVGDSNAVVSTFSLYRDGNYNYTGVNIEVRFLTDTVGATDGDNISDIKKRLIDAKTRRDNITTEHDIRSYINDVDANIQIIKKRNDIEDRRYYIYTLVRYNGEISPCATVRLYLKGVQNFEDYGDFDYYDKVTDRKVLKAYNKFQLLYPEDPEDYPYAVKVPHDANEEGARYLTCPFMLMINDKEITGYYFNTVNDDITLNTRPLNNVFPFKMITRNINIYRDAHASTADNMYTFTVRGALNTSNDNLIVDENGNILDYTGIMAYLVFKRQGADVAYLPMPIAAYDEAKREFIFTGNIETNDFITELDTLEINSGLYQLRSEKRYNSTVDYKDAYFELYYMFKYDDPEGYYEELASEPIYNLLPSSRTDGYMFMNSYYNVIDNPYNLMIDFNKVASSPTICDSPTPTTIDYAINEVPFMRYDWGTSLTINLANEFKRLATVYMALVKLTTDFDVSLKFINTYGQSRYITVTGGRSDGEDIVVELKDLNPVLSFKLYGKGADVSAVREAIYEYLRDTYITGSTVFISNICTMVEQQFNQVKSIRYLGVNEYDASFQEFTYKEPEIKNVEQLMKFVPEQLNITDIRIELDEETV